MAFKLIWCCCHVICTHGMVKETLPQQIYNVLQKSYENFYNVVVLEVSKPYGITPISFNIKKTPCVGKPSKKFLLLWGKELAGPQFKLIELTIGESVQKLFDLETKFISKFSLYTIQRRSALENKTPLRKIWKETPFEKNQENYNVGKYWWFIFCIFRTFWGPFVITNSFV